MESYKFFTDIRNVKKHNWLIDHGWSYNPYNDDFGEYVYRSPDNGQYYTFGGALKAEVDKYSWFDLFKMLLKKLGLKKLGLRR